MQILCKTERKAKEREKKRRKNTLCVFSLSLSAAEPVNADRTDLTERRMRTQFLRSDRSSLRLVFGNGPFGVVSFKFWNVLLFSGGTDCFSCFSTC